MVSSKRLGSEAQPSWSAKERFTSTRFARFSDSATNPDGKLLRVFEIAAGDGTTNVEFGERERELYVTMVKDPKDPQAKGSIVKIYKNTESLLESFGVECYSYQVRAGDYRSAWEKLLKELKKNIKRR